MPAETLPYNAVAAWLEYFPPQSSNLKRITLDSLPCTLGRAESADITIESNRVSREHAAFEQGPSGVIVRDLGSTNGTHVNGKKVDEQTLVRGDIVQIADIELAFCTGQPRNATMLMPAPKDTTSPGINAIRTVRTMQESLSRCESRIEYLPVVDLATNQLAGLELATSTQVNTSAVPAESPILQQLTQLRRWLATDEVATLSGVRLVMPICQHEIAGDAFFDSLQRLESSLGGEGQNSRIVVMIPHKVVCELAHFPAFFGSLRESGVLIGFDEFSGNRQQLLLHSTHQPDYFRLSASLTNNIAENEARQEHLKQLLAGSEEQGSQIMVTGLESEQDRAYCSNAGCKFGQGPIIGNVAPIEIYSRGEFLHNQIEGA